MDEKEPPSRVLPDRYAWKAPGCRAGTEAQQAPAPDQKLKMKPDVVTQNDSQSLLAGSNRNGDDGRLRILGALFVLGVLVISRTIEP